MPRDEPEVPLLMPAVERQLSAEHGLCGSSGNDGLPCSGGGDDELERICSDLLSDNDGDDSQPHLSPLSVMDKSALVVGMSHDIDDVVDSVINHDDLPPLTDLSVLPPPSLSPAAGVPTKPAATVESVSMPKLSSNLNVHVNSEPAVLVRLRRLSFHRYCSPDKRQCVDPSVSSNCFESLNVTSVSDTACKPLSVVDETCNAASMSVKQEADRSTSKPVENGPVVPELQKSVSHRPGSGSERLPVKKSVVRVSGDSVLDTDRHSPLVVLTELSVDTVKSAAGQLQCSQVEVKSERPVPASQSSSVKRKSATTAPDVSVVKKQRSDTPNNRLHWYAYLCCLLCTADYNVTIVFVCQFLSLSV